MYRLIICVFLLNLLTYPAFASRTVVTQTPYQNQYFNRKYNPRYYNNYWNQDLSALENYVFSHNYSRENNLRRLQRLEEMAFGAVQQGDFDTRYNNVRNAILSRPKAHTNSSVWQSIGNYFSGQMTGYTPQIDNLHNYNNNLPSYFYTPSTYGNTSFTNYSSPFGGHGTRVRNFGTSSGSGITILD